MKPRFPSVLLAVLALVAGGLAFAQPERPGEGVVVRAAVADWQSALPVEGIVSELLRELGYEIEGPTTLTPPFFYQAVARGEVDYWPNSWMPQQEELLPEDFHETASFAGTVIEAGAIQGYMVSKDAADEFGITSLADFKRPEVQEAFDPDGNGTIEMPGCIPGWACSDIIRHHMETYGLSDIINVLQAAYTPAFADTLARHRAGEPVLYYAWTPNFTVYEMPPGEEAVWINVPEIVPVESQEGLVDSMTASGVEGAVTDPVKLGFAANDIEVAANDEFLEANPAARALFEQVELSIVEVSEMTLRTDEEDVRDIAREWIEDNRELVDGWLQAAREAAAD